MLYFIGVGFRFRSFSAEILSLSVLVAPSKSVALSGELESLMPLSPRFLRSRFIDEIDGAFVRLKIKNALQDHRAAGGPWQAGLNEIRAGIWLRE